MLCEARRLITGTEEARLLFGCHGCGILLDHLVHFHATLATLTRAKELSGLLNAFRVKNRLLIHRAVLRHWLLLLLLMLLISMIAERLRLRRLHRSVWRLGDVAEGHLLEHALQGNTTLPLLDHLLVHALVIVLVLPALFLSVVGVGIRATSCRPSVGRRLWIDVLHVLLMLLFGYRSASFLQLGSSSLLLLLENLLLLLHIGHKLHIVWRHSRHHLLLLIHLMRHLLTTVHPLHLRLLLDRLWRSERVCFHEVVRVHRQHPSFVHRAYLVLPEALLKHLVALGEHRVRLLRDLRLPLG